MKYRIKLDITYQKKKHFLLLFFQSFWFKIELIIYSRFVKVTEVLERRILNSHLPIHLSIYHIPIAHTILDRFVVSEVDFLC